MTPARQQPFQVLQLLGQGSSCVVYKATFPHPKHVSSTYAVKQLRCEYVRDTQAVHQLEQEAMICSRMAHPNIVRTYWWGSYNHIPYIVMEYVHGTSLANVLRKAAKSDSCISFEAVLWLADQLLRALQYLHRPWDEYGNEMRLVHADVSPGNVLICRNGQVKLCDFGTAQNVHRRQKFCHGKPGYMTPEHFAGQALDERSDLFALGIVLCETILAKPLFFGDNKREVLIKNQQANLQVLWNSRHRMPSRLFDILTHALHKTPQHRFQTASHFQKVLQDFSTTYRISPSQDHLKRWAFET